MNIDIRYLFGDLCKSEFGLNISSLHDRALKKLTVISKTHGLSPVKCCHNNISQILLPTFFRNRKSLKYLHGDTSWCQISVFLPFPTLFTEYIVHVIKIFSQILAHIDVGYLIFFSVKIKFYFTE